MKKMIQVQEVENEGLFNLMGQVITVFCNTYIYSGKLVGVNDTCILLEDAGIVYETGNFADAKWKDRQALPHPIYLQIDAIEMFTVLK